ncbi:MAG: 16S rRNA (adenine(1518)-N(6)/adenine(1519)-N(6))-dimethyltransferase RsmA [Candidatus Nanohaloarchaea archaeon]
MKIRQKLDELGIKPTEGQHFLESEAVIQALVESGEADGKHVLEIGGGTGSITLEILEKTADLTVVEKDTTMANHLEKEFPEAEVLKQDFLDLEMKGYERCISNIPFQLSGDILQRLGEAQIQSSLIVQEELADKIVAEPGSGKYSEMSVRMSYYFIPVKLQKVPKSSFYPEPEVDAAILKLYPNRDRHGVEDEERFFRIVKALFTQQRKKVRNAFVDARHILEMGKEEAKKVRDDLPHSERRVNELEVIEFRDIAEFVG